MPSQAASRLAGRVRQLRPNTTHGTGHTGVYCNHRSRQALCARSLQGLAKSELIGDVCPLSIPPPPMVDTAGRTA